MFPKIHVGSSQTQHALEHKDCADKHVSCTYFKGLLFYLPLWLLIHLFVDLFFIASGAEGMYLMCSHGSLYQRGRKSAAAFRSKGGERDMSTYLWLHYKSLWLILWGDEKDVKCEIRVADAALIVKTVCYVWVAAKWSTTSTYWCSLQHSDSWPLAVLQQRECQQWVTGAAFHSSSSISSPIFSL